MAKCRVIVVMASVGGVAGSMGEVLDGAGVPFEPVRTDNPLADEVRKQAGEAFPGVLLRLPCTVLIIDGVMIFALDKKRVEIFADIYRAFNNQEQPASEFESGLEYDHSR